ncbi:Hsp20 family protein [Parahaliea sp. F7430]|uniref:Hsp20 family protein n=1 Tax=Sediminihaliea albiluteola TaxID=2758564 RepID=A0A7W2TVJ5_9GAMM|nr:Hsp20 family protein [Sediminihaliea albiluteola]MBA6412734.1 Hsp20 family protein [Sediminihaliea albiluteola]
MNTIDFSPLYRNSVGFDRMASLLDAAFRNDTAGSGYPPYNIESLDDSRYAITLAVAGFKLSELDIHVEGGVLTVSGRKEEEAERKYLHRGIANRAFERKFNLAEHVEVRGATLEHGLLTIQLLKQIPEAMKPRRIAISKGDDALEHDSSTAESKATDKQQAA